MFTHVHSSPLSLTTRLHWCHSNCSHINNGWTLSRPTSIYIIVLVMFMIYGSHSNANSTQPGYFVSFAIFSQANKTLLPDSTSSYIFMKEWMNQSTKSISVKEKKQVQRLWVESMLSVFESRKKARRLSQQGIAKEFIEGKSERMQSEVFQSLRLSLFWFLNSMESHETISVKVWHDF